MSYPLVICLILLLSCVYVHGGCVEGVCPSFSTHNMPLQRTFQVNADGKQTSHELSLVAAGMRKKKFVGVIEVDVYAVGVYVSSTKDDELQKEQSLASIWRPAAGDDAATAASMSFVLHFVRDVNTKTVVDAIVDALASDAQASDEYTQALAKFQDELLQGIGSGGIKKDEEIAFVFFGVGSVDIYVRGSHVSSTHHEELRRRLSAVYVSEKAVAPAVHEVLTLRYV